MRTLSLATVVFCIGLTKTLVFALSPSEEKSERNFSRTLTEETINNYTTFGVFLKDRSSSEENTSSPSLAELWTRICVANVNECNRSCCAQETEKQFYQAVLNDTRNAIVSSVNPVWHDLTTTISTFSEELRSILLAFKHSTFLVLARNFRLPTSEVEILLENLISRLIPFHSTGIRHRFPLNLVADFYDDLFFVAVRHLMKIDLPQGHDISKGKRCLAELRHDPRLMPFSHYPSLFEQYMKRPLGMGWTFASGLQAVSEMLNLTVSLDLGENCLRSITKLTYCSQCLGLTGVLICPRKCSSILSRCLKPLISIVGYIRKLANATDTVKTELSAVTVFDTILPSLVSESLLKIIENGHTYRNQIVRKCGFAKANGSRQAASDAATGKAVRKFQTSDQIRVSVDALKAVLLRCYEVLAELPDAFCNDSSKTPATAAEETRCWNGMKLIQQEAASDADAAAADAASEEMAESGDLARTKQSVDFEEISTELSQITWMIHHRRDAWTKSSNDAAPAGDGVGWITFKPFPSAPSTNGASDDDNDDDDDYDEDNEDEYDYEEYEQASGDDSHSTTKEDGLEIGTELTTTWLTPETAMKRPLSSASDVIKPLLQNNDFSFFVAFAVIGRKLTEFFTGV